MSIDALRWAFLQKGITSSQKFILVALADRAGETDQCWPSINRLCSDTLLNRATVFRGLSELCKKGFINRLSGSETGEVSVYQLVGVDHKGREGDDMPQKAMQRAKQEGSHSATGGVASCDGGGRTVRRGGSHGATQHLYIEPKEEPKEEPPTKSDALVPSARRATHAFGEYSHVRMTDQERHKLDLDYGPEMAQAAITFLDEYIEEKPAYAKKSKNHYLAIRRWVINAVKEKHGTMKRPQTEWELKQEQQRRFDAWYMERLNERDKGRSDPRSADGCEFVREFSD